MNDTLLVGVLDRLAYGYEQLEPLAGGQVIPVAVLGDGQAPHKFHHKVRTPGVGRSPVEDLGNARMVHERQRLPLRFEPRDHLPGVHAELDDLQRHPPVNRLRLLRHVDGSHPAFADPLEQLVPAHQGSNRFGSPGFGENPTDREWGSGLFLGLFLDRDQLPDAREQRRITLARSLEECPALGSRKLQCFAEQVLLSIDLRIHGWLIGFKG